MMKRACWLPLSLLLLAQSPHLHAALDPPLRFRLTNASGAGWTAKPITSGVMLPLGATLTTTTLALAEDSGAAIPTQMLATAWWPDHSIKWVLLDFQATLASSATRYLTLSTGTPPSVSSSLSVTESPTQIIVQSGVQALTYNKNEFQVLGREFQVTTNGVTYRATPFAAPEADAFPSPALPWQIEESGPMKIVLRSEGEMRDVGGTHDIAAPYIRYRARLYFYAGQTQMKAFVTLRNNQPFNWSGSAFGYPMPYQNFSTIRLGAVDLAPTTENVFGAGLEKTWEVELSLDGLQALENVIQVDPANSANTRHAEPLLFQHPADVDRIGGFGEIIPTMAGTSASLNAVFARYEKTQMCKVAPEADEQLLDFSAGDNVFDHIAPYLGNYKDYGDLHWESGWSRNHYDWIYSMDLQWLRTGEPRYQDAATIFARHEPDLDVYHTWGDGIYFNFMKNWEGAGGSIPGDHNGPANEFGAGRPSHTWNQGYMLHWLLTGDRRCQDAAMEEIEGARQYLYLGRGGYIGQDPMDNELREIRMQGWLSEVFMTGWLVYPFATMDTGGITTGPVTYKEAVLAALMSIYNLEQNDGGHGYVIVDVAAPTYGAEVAPLWMSYVLEPLIKAHDRLLRGTGDPREAQIRDLIYRITDFLRAHHIGGDTNVSGQYRPLQIQGYIPVTPPSTRPPEENPYQLPYLVMTGNAAAYVYFIRADAASRDFARLAFKDFIYYREAEGDQYVDPAILTPTSYRSIYYVETESKVHGWSGRYGQYYLRMERQAGAQLTGGWGVPTTATVSIAETISYLTGQAPLSPEKLLAADVNSDGHIDAADLVALIQRGTGAAAKRK
ncbi:MAG: hypothetical protein NTX50_16905 [Candidatus Sumerlaeota bacterium]|nr:hypothetical protein [Candidatus Sumerlaeota bacterium]